MIKSIKKTMLRTSAAFTAGTMVSAPAFAGSTSDFSTIASNITTSLTNIPGLLTALSYIFGILIGTLGIMKIKDHVEDPNGTKLKDGAVRLAAGGGLLALPIVYSAMKNTVGTGGGVIAATLSHANFSVN